MIITTTYEQFRNLPKNKGKDSKTIHKEWLLEERKLLMMYDAIQMIFQLNNYNFQEGVFGPVNAGAGGSDQPIPPVPTNNVTYYTPNGETAPLFLGYYTPDIDSNSYYIYITI